MDDEWDIIPVEDPDYVPDYCPICGEVLHEGECDPLKVNTQRRPRFYMMDLHLYKDEFLIDIIKWYAERCKIIEDRLDKPHILQKWVD